MNAPRIASLFTHMALALAGIALTFAELDFLPEAPFILVPYLVFVGLSWRRAGRWELPVWGANLLGLLIAGTGAGYIAARLGDIETNVWLRDVPVTAAIVPFLGPVLMSLLLVRLYRPRAPGDFWILQGLGLLQVALGCVLTSSTLFGIALLAYLVVALCALTAYERHRQAVRSAAAEGHPRPWRRGRWLAFSLRWTSAVAMLALPLFLLTPRAEGPEWEPWSRFGLAQPPKTAATTGFSEEIDLTRSGTLEADETVAFTVTVTERAGAPMRSLPGDQRWRGVVLDRYEDGTWRSGLNWSSRPFLNRPTWRSPEHDAETVYFDFKVSGRAGGLFLAEPAPLGPQFGLLPVWPAGNSGPSDSPPFFYEVEGTIVASSYLARSEYRYRQAVSLSASRDRYKAWRLRDPYLQRLVRVRQAEVETWTRQLLLRLAEQQGARMKALREALQANATTGDPLPPTVWKRWRNC